MSAITAWLAAHRKALVPIASAIAAGAVEIFGTDKWWVNVLVFAVTASVGVSWTPNRRAASRTAR